MKRGDVYEYGVGSHVVRVVVVSADRYNPHRASCAPIVVGAADRPINVVTVPIAHPLIGNIDVARMRAIDPTAIRARLGRLTAADMKRLDQALKTYLGL